MTRHEMQATRRGLKLSAFQRGYIVCALWCGVEVEGSCEPDTSRDMDDLSRETRARLLMDASLFRERHAAFLDAANEAGRDDECLGHDLWLTRNGHGAGFWDRGLGTIGERLSTEARALGPMDLYLYADKVSHL